MSGLSLSANESTGTGGSLSSWGSAVTGNDNGTAIVSEKCQKSTSRVRVNSLAAASFLSHRCSDHDHGQKGRPSFYVDPEVLVRIKVSVADAESMLFPERFVFQFKVDGIAELPSVFAAVKRLDGASNRRAGSDRPETSHGNRPVGTGPTCFVSLPTVCRFLQALLH